MHVSAKDRTVSVMSAHWHKPSTALAVSMVLGWPVTLRVVPRLPPPPSLPARPHAKAGIPQPLTTQDIPMAKTASDNSSKIGFIASVGSQLSAKQG